MNKLHQFYSCIDIILRNVKKSGGIPLSVAHYGNRIGILHNSEIEFLLKKETAVCCLFEKSIQFRQSFSAFSSAFFALRILSIARISFTEVPFFAMIASRSSGSSGTVLVASSVEA